MLRSTNLKATPSLHANLALNTWTIEYCTFNRLCFHCLHKTLLLFIISSRCSLISILLASTSALLFHDQKAIQCQCLELYELQLSKRCDSSESAISDGYFGLKRTCGSSHFSNRRLTQPDSHLLTMSWQLLYGNSSIFASPVTLQQCKTFEHKIGATTARKFARLQGT